MTAAADARNLLLTRKSDERQAVESTREQLVRELLRATEWRSKAGVGAFPYPSQTQDVPSTDELQSYLTPTTDGTFPSLADLIQRQLEPTPEPEPRPVTPPAPDPIVEPEATPEVEAEQSAISPTVKTEEDDALMDTDAEGEVVDKSEPEESQTVLLEDSVVPEVPSIPIVDPAPVPPPTETPDDSRSTSDQDVEMQPATPPPIPDKPMTPAPADPLPSASPAALVSPQAPASPPKPSTPPPMVTTPSPRRDRLFKFDPAKPTSAPRPLSPPEQDTRVPSVDAMRSLLFPPNQTAATPTTVAPADLQSLSLPSESMPPTLPPTPRTPHTPHSRAPSSPTTPKSLATPYAASLPPLPPLPADLARKVTGVKVRRRGAAAAAAGGVNWGGSGVWGINTGAGGGMGIMGPGGGGAQGWWASIASGQAPPPGNNPPPSSTGMELMRWQAVLQINPAHAFARRPTKCVTTHEWRTLRHELEYTRALQRIEQLKADGTWSFRQPKRMRGPVMSKTHWDYLIDEMKWLQIDYREERRWKTVLAFELAHAIREWHAAPPGSDERRAMCVGYVRPKEEPDQDVGMEEKEEENIGPDGKVMELKVDEEEMADEEAETIDGEGEEAEADEAPAMEPAPREDTMGADEVGDGVEAVALGDQAAEEEDQGKDQDEAGVGVLTKDWAPEPEVAPEPVQEDVAMEKPEEEQDNDADADGEAEVDETIVVLAEQPKEADKPQLEQEATKLEEGSLRPDANGQATLISATRDELLELAATASLATTFTIPTNLNPDPSDSTPVDLLTELFPDLSLYTGLPPTVDVSDKRPDDNLSSSTSGKLVHVSRLFDVKPVLAGALEPSRHLIKGKWVGLDEVPAVEDGKEVGPVRQDTWFTDNYLFASDRKPELRRRPESGMIHPMQPRRPSTPQDAAARLERIHWTTEDDALLKSICDAYPNNWSLTADVFNSSRVTIKPDVRTAWDCYDRYRRMFGEPGPEGNGPGPVQGSVNSMRNGFPIEIALPSPGGTINKKDNKIQVKRATPAFENRKQVRQHFLYDTVRKVVRKRENAAKANQPPKRTIPPPHETHSQIQSGQRIYTPAELSKLKAERDARHYQELIKRRQEIYQQAVAAGRPVPRMPGGMANLPQIRNVQMNVQQQVQMQLQAQQMQSAGQTGASQSQAQPNPSQTGAATQPGSQDPQTQAQLVAGRVQTPLSNSQRIQPQSQGMQAGVNGHTSQMSPPGQASSSPNLHAPGIQAGTPVPRPSPMRPGSSNGSPGIVNGQAMSHLLRTNGLHQMHMNLVNGGIPPNMQVNGNSIFANGTGGIRGQLGPEQLNHLILQQAARQMQQNQQNQQPQTSQQPQPQLQAPNVQQPTTDGDVTMQ